MLKSFHKMLSVAALVFLGAPFGTVQGDEPDRAQARNRIVRVVTVSQDGLRPSADTLTVETMERLDLAASFRPDIACLPETFTLREPESLPGPTSELLSAWAREHHCYVVFSIHVQSGEHKYNSAVLIDREGAIVGRYDKIRPTEGELDKSVCPGAVDLPVFETDFGKIGMQICFDVNWHDQWRQLKEKGAQIVFFPSAYPAARHLKTHAWLNQYFIVSSTKGRPSSIYDIAGEQMATSGRFQYWAGAEIPLGMRMFEIDFHTRKMREIAAKYGPRVRITWYHDDDLVSLASLDPDLTVDDIIAEFELTPHTDYLERCRQVQDEYRSTKGPDVASQTSAAN
ncbi:MAG: carbon-nitrogen hydrolase family protein [Pirellulaceae bacterium]|nr:carbon-nitrogen hydrolase family protein [Pirellulaceae bacterium]